MLFAEQGFSPLLTLNEFQINNLIDELRRGTSKRGTPEDLKHDDGFDLLDHYMSDRQCAKRTFLKRGNTLKMYPNYRDEDKNLEKGDYISDDDVNKMIYGFDLRKKQENSYSLWKSDNENGNLLLNLLKEPLNIPQILSGKVSGFSSEDPEIVSERIDGINADESPDENLDSPFKPLRREDRIFEDIYTLKKELRNDFYQLYRIGEDFQSDRNYIKDVLQKITTFKINTTFMPEDYRRSEREGYYTEAPNDPSSLLEGAILGKGGYRTQDIDYEFGIGAMSVMSLYGINLERLDLDFPIAFDHTEKLSHFINNMTFNVSGLYGILHSLKVLCRQNLKKAETALNHTNKTQFLDFVIKPESHTPVYLKLNSYLKKIIDYRNNFRELELEIDNKITLVDAFKATCDANDAIILRLKVTPFAKAWALFRLHFDVAGNPNPDVYDFEDGRRDYERERARLEKIKQEAAQSLMTQLSVSISPNITSVGGTLPFNIGVIR